MDAFAALADPKRQKIVELLAQGERSVGELSREFSISGPAVSQHLKVLRDADLVEVKIDAQRRIYRLHQETFMEMQDWLTRISRFWTSRVDRLEAELRKQD